VILILGGLNNAGELVLAGFGGTVTSSTRADLIVFLTACVDDECVDVEVPMFSRSYLQTSSNALRLSGRVAYDDVDISFTGATFEEAIILSSARATSGPNQLLARVAESSRNIRSVMEELVGFAGRDAYLGSEVADQLTNWIEGLGSD
jgi:hypothetical protein